MEVLEDRCVPSAGALDTTFGTGGMVTTSFLGPTTDLGVGGTAIQADGKIVEAGQSLKSSQSGAGPALARYNADGSLDTTFGSGGKVVPDYTRFVGAITAVAIQSDGKIVTAGFSFQSGTGGDFALARYNSDGSLDTSFGTGGMVATDFAGSFDEATGVAIQTDGKIVAAGFASEPGGGRDFALARYNSDGSLDTGFGSGGKVTTDFAGSVDQASSVALQSNGKIVAAGFAVESSTPDFALARYNSDGSLDTGFGSGGKVTTDFAGSVDEASSVALQSDGKIVAAGVATLSGTGFDFGLARYNSNGSLDTSFGNGGKLTTDFGTFNEVSRAVVIQTDGKIVAAGFDSFGTDFLLARYNSDGSLDGGFGSGGKLTTDFGNTPDYATGVALQSDGKIVAGGESVQPGTGYDFALARYTASGTLDTSFGSGGKVITNLAQGPIDAFGRGGVAVQADGKLVVAGAADRGFSTGGDEFALARYNTDGSLDSSFGSGGRVTTSFPGQSLATSEVIQADGKIVLAGITLVAGRREDFALARYNSDGSLDTSFGSGGKVDTDFGPYTAEAFSVALQSDGKIVVAGGVNQGFADTFNFALARYNSDGTLDSSFGLGGKVITAGAGNGETGFHSVAIQADGKIVAAGETPQNRTLELALLRYNGDGSLDTSFGSKGEVLTSFGNSDFNQANSVAIQADGKIVAAGTSNQALSADFALARYNSDGSPDKSFGKNGQVITDFSGTFDTAFSVALQGDGKIVAAGESYQFNHGYNFALARYNPDGSLDSNFGNSGLVLTDFGGGGIGSQAIGVAIQADGNIVAAGTAFQNGSFDFAVARYIGVAPSTAINQIYAIIANVQTLAATGVLTNGQGNALQGKLQDAIEYLGDGLTTKAVNELQAFVNEVTDFISKHVLTSAQGQPLIDEALAVIALLGGK